MTTTPDVGSMPEAATLPAPAPARVPHRQTGTASVPAQGGGQLLRLPRRRRLSIAMIGLRGVPATYGGIEHHVEELGARLADRGHEVTVYCRSNYSDTELEMHRGMHLQHLRSVATKHLEAITHSAVSAAAAVRQRPDVVHFHAVGPGLVSPMVRALGDSAIVQTVHGLDGERAKWGRVAAGVLRFGERVSARVPDETIVVSRYLADHFRDAHAAATAVIPNGIEVQPHEPLGDLRGEHGLTPGSYALFVGRLVPEKRPDLLLEAFRQIDTDKRLVIAGGDSFSSDYVQHLHDLAARDPRVLMLGYVYGQRLNALYSNTAAYVMPSDLEGQGITLLEAASFGAPVVASDIGPLVESVGHSRPGASLFPAGDVRALRDVLAATLAGGDAVRAGADDLHRRIVHTYSWDTMTDQVEAVYHRAAASRVFA